jgi:hypothetical protein
MAQTTTVGYSGTISTGTTLGHSGTSTINGYSGCTISTGTTLNTNLNGTNNTYLTDYTFNPNNMRTRQVKAAVFTIKRDKDTNEINSTTFLKELWVEQKNGTSIDLLVAKKLDKDFDPENTIIKVLSTVSF